MRWLRRGALAFLVLTSSFALASTAYYHLHSGAPNPAPTADLHGESCRLKTDAYQITHIRADSENAGWACLGWVEARDRGWQMDYLRRLGHGRLAEVMGVSALPGDIALAFVNLEGEARRIYAGLAPASKRLLEVYAAGVSRGFREHPSYEFAHFGYDPAPWAPEDSVLLLLIQSFGQSKHGIDRAFFEEKLVHRYGAEKAGALLDETATPWYTSILKSPVGAARAPRTLPGAVSFLGDFPEISAGSNSWVVSPARSASGHAWVSGDPHLGMVNPPYWYWIHLETPAFDFVAGGLPGAPIFGAGVNRHLAWSPTNSFMDDVDVVDAPESSVPIRKRSRTVWVKLGWLRLPIPRVPLWNTPDGAPVIPPHLVKTRDGFRRFFWWSGFEIEAADIDAFLSLPRAKSANELDGLLAQSRIPSWNISFADDKGQFGFRTIGRGILRGKRDSGARTAENGWPAYLASLRRARAPEMPHAMNPRAGFVATANNPQLAPADPRTFGNRYHSSFRAFRIEELLAKEAKLDPEANRRVQCDSQFADARFLVPLLRDHLNDSLRTAFADWERSGFPGNGACKACGAFRLLVTDLKSALDLDDVALYQALKTGNVVTAEALRAPLEHATQVLGQTWDRLNRAEFPHLSGKLPAVFSGGLAVPGSDNSVSPAEGKWNGHYFAQAIGANHRVLVELSSPPKVFLSLSGYNQDHELSRPLPLEGEKTPFQRYVDCELPRIEYPMQWQPGDAAETLKF
jgi:penicillin amidase